MTELLTTVGWAAMAWGSLKMPLGRVSAGSASLRPIGASPSLLVIVYLPLSRDMIASDVGLQKLCRKTTLRRVVGWYCWPGVYIP